MQDNIAVQRLLEGLLDTPWEEDKAAKEDEERDDAHQAQLRSTIRSNLCKKKKKKHFTAYTLCVWNK